MSTNPPAGEFKPVFIINPTAGRGQAGRRTGAVSQRLREYGLISPVWHYTQSAGDALRLTRQAISDGASLVVAVGGDGTLHEVVNGLLGSQATLGVIPFGTGNDFARALGLFGDLDKACRAIVLGDTRLIDIGTIEGEGTGGPKHFLAIAGMGFDACTARTVNTGIKHLSGASAYVWGAILTARRFEPFRFTLTLDGGAARQGMAMFISIANTATTGGGMKIAPGAQIDDGLLDICLVEEVGKLQLLWQMTKVFEGAHVKHPAVTILRASRVTVEAEPPQPLLIDGEVCGTTPAKVTIQSRILPVKAPAA
jgi:diacylglycerol kinase (ATP)